jgi:lysophospholipase
VNLFFVQPFLGLNSGSFRDSSVSWLELLDGGTNRENIPFSSLFLKARQQEVVLAIDGSADTDNNWPKCVHP